MIDPTPLWDFDDPVASERRLREAAESAEPEDRLVLTTQVARALGLQERFEEGHGVLDHLSPTTGEVAVRIALERGRLLRSAGRPADARPHFAAAAQTATSERLDVLLVDALHMLALVAEPAERLELTERALRVARASPDQRARDWDASLLNNLGMVHAEAGDHAAALASFEAALAARRRLGDDARTRVARWMVGWALRHLDRPEDALAVQRALKSELDALGESDPHVEEELALLEAQTRT